jgi:hypothetical protein
MAQDFARVRLPQEFDRAVAESAARLARRTSA